MVRVRLVFHVLDRYMTIREKHNKRYRISAKGWDKEIIERVRVRVRVRVIDCVERGSRELYTLEIIAR